MATDGGVGDGSQAFLFHGFVRKRLAICVLTIPDGLWYAIFEADHVMFPVPDVVSEFAAEYGISEIISIEIHIKGVKVSRAVVVNNDSAADGPFCLSPGVRHNTIQPFGTFSDIHVRREVDIHAVISIIVENMEVMKRERCRRIGDTGQVDLRMGVGDLRIHVGREILFPDVEPNQGCCRGLRLLLGTK